MSKIDTSTWKDFHLYDDQLFEINSGNKFDKNKMNTDDDSINFIGRTAANNGINGKCGIYNNTEPYPAGYLTLALGGSVGACFVQKDKFYTSQNVAVLIPRHEITYKQKAFIASAIFKTCSSRYAAFVDELNRHIKTDFTIKLPVTASNIIDWDFIEYYMNEMLSKRIYAEKLIDKYEFTKMDTQNWKEFRVGDLFDVSYGKFIPKKDSTGGNIPHITSSGINNGIGYYVDTPMFPGNCITVASDGAMGASFYQEKPFSASNIVSCLVPHDNIHLTRNIAHFLCSVLKSYSRNYSWDTQKFSVDRIRNLLIKLPVTSSGEIDWNYIEEFMTSCEGKASNNVERVRRGEAEPHSLVDTSDWGSFKISELFDISRPVARSQNSYSEGSTPFVASGNTNNGVVRYCQPDDGELLDKGNCITVSPLDGSSFYQKDDFLGRGGAGSAIIILRNEKLNENNAMFVCAVLRATLNKCSYSDQLSSSSIINQVIKLPVSPDGSPNFAYMENYIENLKRSI